MQAKLTRCVYFQFSKPLAKIATQWREWSFEVDIGSEKRITVKGYPLGEVKNGSKQLVIATCHLTTPLELTPAKRVIVPTVEHEELESAIENIANLISVAIGARRYITSPSYPIAAIEPLDDEMKDFLNQAEGFLKRSDRRYVVASGVYHQFDMQNNLNALSDRLDGIALMAEAVANTHATGRFREHIRLFERAFRRASSGLVAPLTGFLEAASLGYTEDEILKWMHFRHLATHADNRPEFLTERQAVSVADRVEQAAFDILFNKANWRSNDTERRQLYRPKEGTLSDGVNNVRVFFTKEEGHEGLVAMSMLDDLGSFHISLVENLSFRLPDNVWAKPFLYESDDEGEGKFLLEVRGPEH